MAPMVHLGRSELLMTLRIKPLYYSAVRPGYVWHVRMAAVIDAEMNVEHYWEEMIRYYLPTLSENMEVRYKGALQKLSGLEYPDDCSYPGLVWREFMRRKCEIDIYDV